MMWTRVKLKKPEPSVEFRRAYLKYTKIMLVIRSCKTGDHIIASATMINNFHAWLIKCNVTKEVISKLITSLEGMLENKIKDIRIP